MKPALVARFSELATGLTGIQLGARKASMVTARVQKRMRTLGIAEPEAYWQLLSGEGGAKELEHFVNALTTNVTQFWREPAHFELFRRFLAEMPPKAPLRIWFAATSTGQELWTLAILASIVRPEADTRILGTDIDTQVLRSTRRAWYPEIDGLPAELRSHFERCDEGGFQVAPALRSSVHLARLNLTRTPYPMKGPFDAIFCRNVMIYFDAATRQRIVTEAERLLRPGGLLVLGHSESLQGLRTRLRAQAPAVYERPAQADQKRLAA